MAGTTDKGRNGGSNEVATNGNGATNGHAHEVPARCVSCPFYRLGKLTALRSAPGEPWRCDLVPGHVYGRAMLATEGMPARQVFAVRTGLGRVFRTLPNGRVVALRLVRPGELVGMETITSGEYATSFESLGDLQYCSGDPKRIGGRALAVPELAREVQTLTVQELEAYRKRIVSLAVLDRRGRLAELLLDMERGAPDRDGWCEMLLAQQEAAELLGSTQETMSRVLADMARRRWIVRRGKQFRILNREALAVAAAGEMERPAPGRHVAPAES